MPDKFDSPGGKRGLFAKRRRARKERGRDSELSDKRKQIRESRRAANRKGCSTRTLMLVLPFFAMVAYLLTMK